MKRARPSFRKDTRGAVLVEFVIAIVPLLTIFFVMVQLSQLAVARLIVKHSAVVGARAAAVFHNEHENAPSMCKDDGKKKVDQAVRVALGGWSDRITTTTDVTDRSNREVDGVYDLVTVKVNAAVRCRVPLGRIICPGGIKVFTETKSMPHQGARYKAEQCRGAAAAPPKVTNDEPSDPIDSTDEGVNEP